LVSTCTTSSPLSLAICVPHFVLIILRGRSTTRTQSSSLSNFSSDGRLQFW
jgi:hypothetical protein